MNRFFKFTKNDLISIFISLSVFAVFSALFSFTTIFEGLENNAINFRFFLRDPSIEDVKIDEGVKLAKKNERVNKDIIILGIDQNTLRQFDAEGIQWPFPWKVHAKFANYVASGKPNSIFFDILFESHKEGQEELAKAVGDSDCTFLDYQFYTEEIDTKYPDLSERLIPFEKTRFPVDPEDTTKDHFVDVLPPNPLISSKAKGIGFANVIPDSDDINRKMPLITKYKGFYYPDVDMLLLMHYYGITEKDVEIKIGKYIKLKNVPLEKMVKKNASRTITIPIDRYGQMYINFIGTTGSYQTVPYFYFYRDDTMGSNNSLNGKLALVAAYTTGMGMAKDVHKAPQYGDMFGIEHHANALNTIMNQDFLINLTDVQNIILLLIIALFLGFMLSRISIVASLATTFLVLMFYMLAGYLLFEFKSVMVAYATPLIMISANLALSTTFRLLTEQKEKKYIRQTFSKFVSKSVVDELLKHPEKIKLGGEKKILTVLFSDVRGFTTLSEKLTPEQLVEHLNEYLQAMTDIVFKYNGTLDKYVGDEIMAFWGAPVPQDNHAYLACKGAVEMMSVLKRMNENWELMGKESLDIGIGLNSGDMVVGNVGSNSRMDYTLMGDNVNLGARLEGTNKVYGTKIIISEFTYELVKDKVIVRELDLIRVKGKHLPVKIYELVALVEDEVI